MRIFAIVLFILHINTGFGQDPQFSQYYSAPLILNPALAGSVDCYRAGINARTQWTGLPGGAFTTGSAFIDLSYYNSGFGLLFLHDVIGTPRMTSTEISGFYSHLVPISKMVNFRLGLQGSYVTRSLDYSRLIFEDQYTGIDLTGQVTTDPIKDFGRTRYGDFSAGIIMFGDEKYWVGFSAHHLNEPEQAFYIKSSPLPMKFSVHGGYNIIFKRRTGLAGHIENDLEVIPTFIYKAQAKFDQLDVGVYAIKAPFFLGFWYRGIAVKQDEKVINSDALIVQAGYQYKALSFIYSYDFTVSRLDLRNTHGSHELSLLYHFCLDWPRRKKPARHARRLPCPDFQRSMRYKKNYLGF